MTRRSARRLGVAMATLPLLDALAFADDRGSPDRGQAPAPAAASTPAARDSDSASGAKEIGIGRATGAIKSSGDEGGTAAGMPNKGPAAGSADGPASAPADQGRK